MTTNGESKVDVLKKKREMLDKRIRKMEALEKQRERKRDTRRKILVGAYTLDQAKENGSTQELYQNMTQYLKRDSDKTLFSLEVSEAAAENK